MLKPHIAPCYLNRFHPKAGCLFYRNISTASFNMQKTLKNIIARCLRRPKNSHDQLPTGTPTQSGNKRRRPRELRRRGWGDLWWEPQSQHFTLVRHQNSISKWLLSFRSNMKRLLCLTFKVLFDVSTMNELMNVPPSFIRQKTRKVTGNWSTRRKTSVLPTCCSRQMNMWPISLLWFMNTKLLKQLRKRKRRRRERRYSFVLFFSAGFIQSINAMNRTGDKGQPLMYV